MGWTTACPDWDKRIAKGESMMPCTPQFPNMAAVALNIFDQFVVADMMGRPEFSEVTRDWAREFVGAIFGAYDPVKNTRLIRDFFLLIPKKNTKSTLAAAIMMTALTLNERGSAEFIILAPTKEVADNSFIPARDIVKADPELEAIFNVSEHTRTITHLETKATLKVVAAESDAAAGKKASLILIDELWLFGKRANAASMIREATGGLVSRTEGCVIYLSTQSDEGPAGVFKQKLEYARKVRDGKVHDPSFLPLLYEFPQKMLDDEAHLDPKNWPLVNPNYGASVDGTYLEQQFKQALESGDEQDFLAKHLNLEIGVALRHERWSVADFWEDAKHPRGFSLTELIEQSEVITLGIDGGGADDLLGLAVVGKTANGSLLLWNNSLCYEYALERRKSIAPKLLEFEQLGELTILKNVGDEVPFLTQIFKQLIDSGKFGLAALDPWRMTSLKEMLENCGLVEDDMALVTQGVKMSPYVYATERLIASGKLKHAGQSLMSWCVGNTVAKIRTSAIQLDKAASGTAKIDPVIATVCAVGAMSTDPKPIGAKGSIFF